MGSRGSANLTVIYGHVDGWNLSNLKAREPELLGDPWDAVISSILKGPRARATSSATWRLGRIAGQPRIATYPFRSIATSMKAPLAWISHGRERYHYSAEFPEFDQTISGEDPQGLKKSGNTDCFLLVPSQYRVMH